MSRFILPLVLIAQALHTGAQSLPEFLVEVRRFEVPEQGPFVDLSVAILGASVHHENAAAGLSQARLELVALVEQAGNIVDHRKVELTGPPRTTELPPDLLYTTAFALPAGEYTLEIQVRDLEGADTARTERRPLIIPALPDGPTFSDVLLVSGTGEEGASGHAHAGRTLIPFVGAYYPSTVERMDLYAELYGMDTRVGRDSLYLLSYQIEGQGTGTPVGAFRAAARVKARAVEPVLGGFDIRSLPSGNYVLALEARDRSGQLLARTERFLQRNNPISYRLDDLSTVSMGGTFADRITEPDSLAEFINCLRPIADDLERKMIDDRWKDREMDLMRRFFYSFWFNRNGIDPESAWKAYRAEVVRVNRLYGSRIKRGYETDRGYVHLKYGAPNTITDRPSDMGVYPYQIWHYYRAGRYTDRRFVFYLPDMVTNDYELLHSEVPGEMQNPRWNQVLHSRDTPMNNVQPGSVNSLSGERSDEFFMNPR